MLVGEQPGDQEDIEGRPFVGPAGGCSTRRWRRPGSTATAPTSRTPSSTSSGSRGASAASTRSRPGRADRRAGPGSRPSSSAVAPRVLVCLGATAAQSLLGQAVQRHEAARPAGSTRPRRARARDDPPERHPEATGYGVPPPRARRIRRRPEARRRRRLQRWVERLMKSERSASSLSSQPDQGGDRDAEGFEGKRDAGRRVRPGGRPVRASSTATR